jgi:uncharacterized membrane protein
MSLIEWGLALIATALAVAAHFLVLFNAGHLWRDEAVSVGLATLPTIGGIWLVPTCLAPFAQGMGGDRRRGR